MEQKNKQKLVDNINIDIILKFYPMALSAVSIICYFIYFYNVGYFPVISGSDIFYFGGLIFFVSFLISLLFIMPTIFFLAIIMTNSACHL